MQNNEDVTSKLLHIYRNEKSELINYRKLDLK